MMRREIDMIDPTDLCWCVILAPQSLRNPALWLDLRSIFNAILWVNLVRVTRGVCFFCVFLRNLSEYNFRKYMFERFWWVLFSWRIMMGPIGHINLSEYGVINLP